jgi:hypothetical protein
LSLSIAKELSNNPKADINNFFLNIKLLRAQKINNKLSEYAKLMDLKYVSEFNYFCYNKICKVVSDSYKPYIYI